MSPFLSPIHLPIINTNKGADHWSEMEMVSIRQMKDVMRCSTELRSASGETVPALVTGHKQLSRLS